MNTQNILSSKKGLVLLSILLIFTATGCVSSKKYETLESKYNDLEFELETARKKNQKLYKEKQKLEQVKNQMIENLKQEIEEKTVRIEVLEQKLKVTAVEKLFFDSGSAVVKRQGRTILGKIAGTLNNADGMEIHVTGHADTRPPGKKISNQYPSNWELSTARATAIVQVLQWGHKVDPRRMIASGVGHYRPSVVETDQNREKNRFVEISLTAVSR